MKNWKKILVAPETSIRETIRIIDKEALKIALVTNNHGHLLGTVTDGDIRRSILNNISLDEPIQKIMNTKPTVAKDTSSRSEIVDLMHNRVLHQIPVTDSRGRIVNLLSYENIIKPFPRENWVVIMAGGEGVRLRPMTNNCPKPMLNVGGKPILETIVENFIDFGFRHFFFSVNYKAEIIENHFEDGSKWNIQIEYLKEKNKLGTAGALSLLPQKPSAPMIVMNGDILSRVNFEHLLTFHEEHSAIGTMCVREYDIQVPFGVAKVDNHKLIALEEKPVQRFFINAGIYVLNPDILDRIPPSSYCDMPTIYNSLIEENLDTAVFPIREYWMDLGQLEDFTRAQLEFNKIFK